MIKMDHKNISPAYYNNIIISSLTTRDLDLKSRTVNELITNNINTSYFAWGGVFSYVSEIYAISLMNKSLSGASEVAIRSFNRYIRLYKFSIFVSIKILIA